MRESDVGIVEIVRIYCFLLIVVKYIIGFLTSFISFETCYSVLAAKFLCIHLSKYALQSVNAVLIELASLVKLCLPSFDAIVGLHWPQTTSLTVLKSHAIP